MQFSNNNSLCYNTVCINIRIWDFIYSWYYQELYCVTICLYIYIVFSLLFTIFVLNQGPMEDHLSVNGLTLYKYKKINKLKKSLVAKGAKSIFDQI